MEDRMEDFGIDLIVAKSNWQNASPQLVTQIYSEIIKDESVVRKLEMAGYFENCLLKLTPTFFNKSGSLDFENEKHAYLMSLIFLFCHKIRQYSDFNSNESIRQFQETDLEALVDEVSEVLRNSLNNNSKRNISTAEESELVSFLFFVFSSLENRSVRLKALAHVSISLWNSIKESKFADYFAKFPQMRVLWGKHKESEKFGEDRNMVIPLLVNQFFRRIQQLSQNGNFQSEKESVRLLELEVDFFGDLLSKISTRKYLRFFFLESQFLSICKITEFYKWAKEHESLTSFKALLDNFEYYLNFEIDDETGELMEQKTIDCQHNINLAILQRICFKYFKDQMTDFVLAPISQIEISENLKRHFKPLSTKDMRTLCERLCLLPLSDAENERLYGNNKEFMLNVVASAYGKKRETDIQRIRKLSLYPTEELLWNKNFIPGRLSEDHREMRLVLPRLNLQFLTMRDYLTRNFFLYRLESTYQIREDLSQVITHLNPCVDVDKMTGSKKTEFAGHSRMAAPIQKAIVTKVGTPLLGETKPSEVTIEVEVDLSPFQFTRNEIVFKEWEDLKRHDIVFLCTINAEWYAKVEKSGQTNAKNLGLAYLRGGEIESVKDENYQTIGEYNEKGEAVEPKGTLRTFVIKLDSAQYEKDLSLGKESLYSNFNLLVRRNAKSNNFKAVLETMRNMMESKPSFPEWLHDILLGYGDLTRHSNASEETKIDFCDTFQDKAHVSESFPQHTVRFEEGVDNGLFSLSFDDQVKLIKVSASSSPVRHNRLRFTPMQINAIKSGQQDGLTLVIGPPGTGKTDVAVQIVNNLYTNNPKEKILLITHSNSALNDLFEKIVKTNIDEKHLLRLGYGYKELETAQNFGKTGRLNHVMKKRQLLLEELGILFKSIGLGDGSGVTCENGGNLFFYHILGRWEAFLKECDRFQLSQKSLENKSNQALFFNQNFPFSSYFSQKHVQTESDLKSSNKNNALFSKDTFEENFGYAQSLYEKLEELIRKVEEFVPFETLRTMKDRGDYLFASYAKIVAMTCTHAALKRKDLIALHSEFDSIVMEEAAQILDVEAFISLALENPRPGHSNRLRRVVMIGDHFQLPPIVQNVTLKTHSRFDQSLFARLVRLQHPSIRLDQQGRARPEIAQLFSWRYGGLGTLPEAARIDAPNAGMAHTFQFVDVGDFCGKGETAPTPHFYQNLGEAEYVVQLYMFLRLAGYPNESVVLLSAYNGQRRLLQDVVRRRCEGSPRLSELFGRPAKISTVDKFQGRQSDIVLLSLVRTKSPGHLKDVRRLIVALSRARQGLYVFGRRELFERFPPLRVALSRLLVNGDKLAVVMGERYGGALQKKKRGVVEVAGVEHLGGIVAELSSSTIAGSKAVKRWREEMEEYSKKVQKHRNGEINGGGIESK